MDHFLRANRRKPMWHTIDYRGVPTYRALALAMHMAALHGAPHLISSSDRRDDVIRRFNRKHHTNLHSQKWCIVMHARDPRHYAPANPVDETSHCLRSDGNRAYQLHGRQIPARGKLPPYMMGIDAQDVGPHAKANDCTHLIRVLRKLGFHVTRPYPAGSEQHHFVFTESPIPVLRRHHLV